MLAASDPHRLEELKYELDGMQVYHLPEVDAFARVFYLPAARQRAADHARLEEALQPARDRFKALDEDEQTAFRERLGAFVNLYAFLSQVIPYGDTEQERLASFGRALLPGLLADQEEDEINLGDDVELAYYRLQRVSSGAISLGEETEVYVVSPTDVGTGNPEKALAPLSEIIKRLNERFGTNFTDEDRLFFEQVKERAVSNERIRQTALANTLEKFSLGIRPEIGKLMMERMGENDALVTRYLSDKDFQNVAFEVLAREIFEAVEARATPTRGTHA